MSEIGKKFAHKWRNKVRYKKGEISKLERDRSYHETLLQAVVKEAQNQHKKKEEAMKKETDQLKELLDAQDEHIKRQQEAMNKILALLDAQHQTQMPGTRRAYTIDHSLLSDPNPIYTESQPVPIPPPDISTTTKQSNRSPLRNRVVRPTSAGAKKSDNNSGSSDNDKSINNNNNNNNYHSYDNRRLSVESINEQKSKVHKSDSIVSQNDSQISVSTTATAPGMEDVHPNIEGIRLCQNCEEHVAIILCEDCDLFLCVKGHCDEVLHRSKAKRSHNRRPMFGAALVATKESRRILIGGSTDSNESKNSSSQSKEAINSEEHSINSSPIYSRRSSNQSVVAPLPRPNSILNYSLVNMNDSDSEISDISSDDDNNNNNNIHNNKDKITNNDNNVKTNSFSRKTRHRVRRSRTMTSIAEQLNKEKKQHSRERSFLPSNFKATGRIGTRLRARPWRMALSCKSTPPAPIIRQQQHQEPKPPTIASHRRRSLSQPATQRLKRFSKIIKKKPQNSSHKAPIPPPKKERRRSRRGTKKSIFHLPPLPAPAAKGKLSTDE